MSQTNTEPWYHLREGESIEEARDRRLCEMPVLSPAEHEVLQQCRMTVWDGNVVSKRARDELFHKGLITRWNGWQVITQEGMAILSTLGEMSDDRWPRQHEEQQESD
jgi:hypothetical protein